MSYRFKYENAPLRRNQRFLRKKRDIESEEIVLYDSNTVQLDNIDSLSKREKRETLRHVDMVAAKLENDIAGFQAKIFH